jgi:redox-sensitive bicupin YhaK (pirin superfamily)
MDPIPMIDELRSEHREDFAGGFPTHPHRGMQTLTYMKHGGIIHEDNQGNRGEIRGEGAQWKSAGRGIIQSEMPTQDSSGLHGFQLWINLPRAEKMTAPRYRDIPRHALARGAGSGFDLTAIAGQWQAGEVDICGPLEELASRAGVADLYLQPGAGISLVVASTESLLGYVYGGAIVHDDMDIGSQRLVVTDKGKDFELHGWGSGCAGAIDARQADWRAGC